MKKALIILTVFILFLIIYLLQSNLFNWFNIAGIKPNIFVILVLFIGLYTNKYIGMSLGIVIGIFLDVFIGRKIGISPVMYGLIGFLGGYLDKTFSKDSRITIMLMVIGTTIIYELGRYILNALILESIIEMIPFIKIVLIETLFNILITIIAYPILQKGGRYIEETFKSPNILTRYF